jgi:hypothetical protein
VKLTLQAAREWLANLPDDYAVPLWEFKNPRHANVYYPGLARVDHPRWRYVDCRLLEFFETLLRPQTYAIYAPALRKAVERLADGWDFDAIYRELTQH